MSISTTTKKSGGKRFYMNAVLTVSLISAAMAGTAPVFAQGLTDSLGADQDSLLPPEVVPLDPAAANQMAANQASSRSAGMTTPASSGLGGTSVATPGDMQSAQDFKKSMYNSLYNQGTLAPQNAQMGSVPQGNMAWSPQGQQAQMGQQNSFGQQQQGFGTQQGQLGQSNWQNTQGAPQSQTLSGAAQNTGNKPNQTFNGAKRVLSTAAGFGGGIMVGALMMSRGAGSAGGLSTGLLGASMLNYGLRSGFRGF